ncbi:MAG: SIS domain-containing protein [Actinomycetota bacterium]
MREVLEDAAALRAGDPSGMLAAFVAVGDQLRGAYAAARASAIPFAGEVRGVAVCAMGGSAAAGDVAAAAFADRAPVTMVTLRGYRVPRGYGEDDLVVCASYSGNTEETVAAFGEARERGCTVVAVCGGGALAEEARRADTPLVLIPTDAPVPRAGLGSLVGGVLGAMVAAGALSGLDEEIGATATALGRLAEDLGPLVPVARNEPKELAAWVEERIPVIWGSEGVGAAAAWRWKTAFNENAEVPAFASMLPELDHHEVVGWTGKRGEGFCLVILREDGEHDRVQARLDATLEELADSGLEWREVRARGDSPLTRCLSLAVLGDMASAYHGLARGIDPAAMDSLVRIKERLSR